MLHSVAIRATICNKLLHTISLLHTVVHHGFFVQTKKTQKCCLQLCCSIPEILNWFLVGRVARVQNRLIKWWMAGGGRGNNFCNTLLSNYSQLSLQRPRLFPVILPLKRICCCNKMPLLPVRVIPLCLIISTINNSDRSP